MHTLYNHVMLIFADIDCVFVILETTAATWLEKQRYVSH